MPLRTLTPQQFSQARPKGSYQSYLRYLNAHRQQPSSVPIAGTKAPLLPKPTKVTVPKSAPTPTYQSLLRMVQGSFLTPAQQEAQAKRMTETDIAAQTSMLDIEQKKAQDDALRRMLALQSAGRAAAAMNAELMGRVGGAYTGAAGELSTMGGALSQAMAGATAADVAAANQSLGNVGAGAVTVGGPVGAPGIAGPTQAGVEQYRGATLPAQQLGTTGSAEQLGMAGLIGSQNLRATQEANAAYMSAVRDAQSSKIAAVKELAAGRPANAQKYLQSLQDNQRQAIALASSLMGQGFEQKMTGKKFAEDVKQAGIKNKQWWQEFSTGKQQWQTEFDEEKRQFDAEAVAKAEENRIDMATVDSAASKVWGHLVNKAGQPILGRDGKLIPIHEKATKGAGKIAGMTPGQYTSLIQRATEQAKTSLYGYKTIGQRADGTGGRRVPAQQAPGFDENDPNTWGKGRQTWDKALSSLTSIGVPAEAARGLLSNTGYARGDVTGRPLFSPYERKVLIDNIGKSRFFWVVRQIQGLLRRGQENEADAMIQQVLGPQTNPDEWGSSAKWAGKPTG